MSLSETAERYRKFIGFTLKYWSSDIVKSAGENAFGEISEETQETNSYEKPEELVEDLKKMGPTYVKLGQLLSTRPDLLPDSYLQALASLQDDVDEVPYEKVQQIIEDEIGVKISKLFSSFDPKPMASASIGQVHKATLNSGKPVAVKVQRPGMRKKFIDDLDTIKSMTALAVKHFKIARQYALNDVIDELRHILLNELDYTKEAQNLITLGKNLTEFKHIIIPQPVMDYCTSRVLTMDFVEGKKITKITGVEKTDTDFRPLVDELVKSYLKQIIVDGFAHADPHPGNVHLTRDNKVALIDLGMVAKFSPDMQDHLLKLLIAISKMDGDAMTEALLKVSQYDNDSDLLNFQKHVNRVMMDKQDMAAKGMDTGRLIMQMNRIAAMHDIKIAVELNILGKILLNMDQIVATLTPSYDFHKAVRDYVEQLLHQKFMADLKPENLFLTLMEGKKFAENMPKRLNTIMERLASNEFSIKVDAIDEKRFTDGFQKVANRITLGLIIAAMIIGAAMLVRVPTTFTIFGYPGLAIILFFIAATAAAVLAYKIVFNDEDLRKKK